MFSKTIIDSDTFLDMPLSAQALYFHLSMRADDEGFVNNPKKIQRLVCASEDDLKVLIAKKFLIVFESGVVVIRHWRIHNYIQSDRFQNTLCIDEKALLRIRENKEYTLVDTDCIQNGYSLDTQDSIGKDSIEIEKDRDSELLSNESNRQTDVQRIVDAWNEIGVNKVVRLDPNSNRAKCLRARIRDYGEDAIIQAIKSIPDSDFLMGRATDFQITFDWFVKPNNFPKVLEGNYANKVKPEESWAEKFLKGL